MGLVTSPDTLLRLIRAQPEEQAPTPRVLGVDDFSFCKRKSYGTILIDLERRVPIEILPDREAATLAKWLKEHEGVEIISRDRGGPYAEGAKLGAKRTAEERNLGEAREKGQKAPLGEEGLAEQRADFSGSSLLTPSADRGTWRSFLGHRRA
jgi:hypothetical protein